MEEPDSTSINLLLMSSPDQHSTSSSEPPSPATQTLNGFSQPQLRISQLELDAASALLQARSEDPSEFMTDAEEQENATTTRVDHHRQRGSKKAPPSTVAKSDSRRKDYENDSSSDDDDDEPAVVTTKNTQTKGRKRKATSQRNILQLDARTGECLGRFESFRAITLATGVHYSTIRGILEGYKEPIRGWSFCYEGDDDSSPTKRPSLVQLSQPRKQATRTLPMQRSFTSPPPETKADSSTSKAVPVSIAASRKKGTRAHVVQQIRVSTGAVVRVHRSLTFAEEMTGIPRQIISRIVKGEIEEHQGWTFRRMDVPPAVDNAPSASIPEEQVDEDGCTKVIEQIEVATGRVVATHATFTAAGQAIQCRRQLVSSIVNGERDAVNGWTFRMRSTVATPHRPVAKQPPPPQTASSLKPDKVVEVIRLATGECIGTYPTYSAAGRAMGCDRRVLSKIANGILREFNGCTVRVQSLEEAPSYQTFASNDRHNVVLPKIHRAAAKSSTLKTPKLPSLPPNYCFIPITIDRPGNLGINAKRVFISEELEAALNAYRMEHTASSRELLKVSSFKKESSLAKRYGVKGGDLLLLAKDGSTLETSYDEVASMIKSGDRPLSLIVARDTNLSGRISPNENTDTSNTRDSRNGEPHHDRSYPQSSNRSFNSNAQSGAQNSGSTSAYGYGGTQPTMRRLAFHATTEKSSLQPLMPIDPTKATSPRLAIAPPQMAGKVESTQATVPRAQEKVTKERPVSSGAKSWKDLPKSEVSGEKRLTAQNHKPVTEERNKLSKSTASLLRKKPGYTSGKSHADSSQSNESTVPFCLVCNGARKKNAFHHAWCPKHPFFEKSGAVEIYDRIISGREIGCAVCEKEYQSGRRCKDPHTKQCQDLEAKKLTKSKQSSAKSEEPDTLDCSEAVSDPGEGAIEGGDDDDELSVYQLKADQQQMKYSKLSLVEEQSSKSKHYSDKGAGKKENSAKGSKPDKAPKKKQVASPPKRGTDKGKSLSKDADNLGAEKNTASTNPEKDAGINIIAWKPAVNPWGASDHLLDDCIVLSQKWNSIHHDYLIPTPRYTFDPFASDCYKETHRDPLQFGFHVLYLERDPLGRLPWGFTVKRHDFGGACIIATVDPLSPASSASIVASGGSLMSPLAVHDIVISIDGKCVGGMSNLSVKLLLEASGSKLTVTVARYLHGEAVRKQTSLHETKMLEIMDMEIADKRRMDWIDAGIEAPDCPDSPSILNTSLCVVSEKKSTSPSNIEGAFMATTFAPILSSPSTLSFPTKKGKPREQEPRKLAKAKVLPQPTPTKPAPNEKAKACVQSPQNEDGAATPSAFPDPTGSATQSSDEGDAWFNCICQNIHDEAVPLFWIRCDACASWYNVASGCIGFDVNQAKPVRWICPGCPSNDSHTGDLSLLCCDEPHGNSMKSFLPASPTMSLLYPCQNDAEIDDESKEEDFKSHNWTHQEPQAVEKNATSNDANYIEPIVTEVLQREQNEKVVFKVGERVNVQQHSWSRVNNPSGLAVIHRAYKDANGGQVYDIKYVIEKVTKKAVLAMYLSPFSLPSDRF